MQRSAVIWFLGVCIGLFAAAAGILREDFEALRAGSNAIAEVNGVAIHHDTYRRLLNALETDLSQAPDPNQARMVLDRLIDEELLVQRGVELGLVRSDRRVRADLVSAVIAAATVDPAEPSEAELLALFQREAGRFAEHARYRVQQIYFRGASDVAMQRAVEARRQLGSGQSFETLMSQGDDVLPALPNRLLPATKLAEYLGATRAAIVLELDLNEISLPLRDARGVALLRLVEKQAEMQPDFAAVREQVRSEWRRQAEDRALREYVDELRRRAEIRTVPKVD